MRRFDQLTVRLSLTVLSGAEWTAPSEVEGLRSWPPFGKLRAVSLSNREPLEGQHGFRLL